MEGSILELLTSYPQVSKHILDDVFMCMVHLDVSSFSLFALEVIINASLAGCSNDYGSGTWFSV